MCFHYSLTIERAEIEIQLGAQWDDDWEPVFHANGFSFLQMPVITQNEPDRIQLFHWGLIPTWVKSKADADKLKVCMVDIGEDKNVQIVCGGSNLYKDELVVVCKPGAEVI